MIRPGLTTRPGLMIPPGLTIRSGRMIRPGCPLYPGTQRRTRPRRGVCRVEHGVDVLPACPPCRPAVLPVLPSCRPAVAAGGRRTTRRRGREAAVALPGGYRDVPGGALLRTGDRPAVRPPARGLRFRRPSIGLPRCPTIPPT